MPRSARPWAFGLIPLMTLGLSFALSASAAPSAPLATNRPAPVKPSVTGTPAQAAPPATSDGYTTLVKPIFETACGKCHLNGNHRGAFNMDTRSNLLKGGHDGVVVIPGDPANSLLIKLIRHEGPADDPMPMPPHAPKLSDADIATITQWVKAGALMP